MDELDRNLLAAWDRVFAMCRGDPAEARRRYARVLPGAVLDRPHRAWCVALRASDTRLMDAGYGVLGSEPATSAVRARAAHEVVLEGGMIRELGGPVWLRYPGVPLTEAAALLGRDYAGLRGWLPVGAGRSRVERARLAATGDSVDGRLKGATFSSPGYPLKVRYEPPACRGRRGRETPVVWSDGPLDPGGHRGKPPARWWGTLWQSLAEGIPHEFEQVLERVPKYLPCLGEMRFRGWLWRCPGLEPGRVGPADAPADAPADVPAGCGRLVPKLYAPLPVWTVGRHLGLEEGLAVEGLAGRWYPGVMDRWAGRRRLACRHCWRVRDSGAAERHGWNELVSHLSGGLLYGREVEKPAGFEYERRRAFRRRGKASDGADPIVSKPAMSSARMGGATV